MVDYKLSSTRRPGGFEIRRKKGSTYKNGGFVIPPITNEPEPITGDCKSTEHKEVRTFFNDGLQIRRNT